MDHDPSGWPALLGKAEAAVADATTRGADPGLAQQGLPHLLPVAVAQARTTELPHTHTERTENVR